MNGRGLDFTAIIQNAFHMFKGKLTYICSGPCDGFVLKMHYRWSFYFCIGGFMAVWYGWYFGKTIHCVSSFKGDQEARIDYTNICLSYPYVLNEDGEKRFLLFYRWIHWSFLLMAFLFYLPRKISKSIENSKAKKVLEDLSTLSPRYDQAEKDAVQRAYHYMVTNMRTQNNTYYKYLGLNLFALFIDIFALFFYDFMLHNRFKALVPDSYPFHRDPVKFKDFISLTFPPFAFCTLSDEHKILDGRTEEIGCHLTNMEFYEKLFFIFWFLIYILIVVSILQILYLLTMLVPNVQRRFIGTSKPLQAPQTVQMTLVNVTNLLRVGDIYMLYRLKQHLSPTRFYELLLKLSNPQLQPKEPVKSKFDPKQNFQEESDVVLRNRGHTNPAHPYNPTYPDSMNNHVNVNKSSKQNAPNLSQLQKILKDPRNSDFLKLYPQLLDSKGLKDTSILIE